MLNAEKSETSAMEEKICRLDKVPYNGFTYREYKRWEETRVELIDGLVYMMASPNEWHQWVTLELLN